MTLNYNNFNIRSQSWSMKIFMILVLVLIQGCASTGASRSSNVKRINFKVRSSSKELLEKLSYNFTSRNSNAGGGFDHDDIKLENGYYVANSFALMHGDGSKWHYILRGNNIATMVKGNKVPTMIWRISTSFFSLNRKYHGWTSPSYITKDMHAWYALVNGYSIDKYTPKTFIPVEIDYEIIDYERRDR